jgi:transposase-like protein
MEETLLHSSPSRLIGQTRAHEISPMPSPPPSAKSAFAGFRFPPEVITLAVRWYLRFGLSYRDVEELLAERGIEVDHVSIDRWVHRFAPEFALHELAESSARRQVERVKVANRVGAVT